MSLRSWSRGPYGPACSDPMWACNKCDKWVDDPCSDLPACPSCGYDGYTLTIRVNGKPVAFREFTTEERDALYVPAPEDHLYVVLLNEIRRGDDLTHSDLSPRWSALWVRFPMEDGHRGNMRLHPPVPDILRREPW